MSKAKIDPVENDPKKKRESRRRGRPVKGSEAKVAEDIIAAAQQLFFDRGYEGTSTDDVAALANCSKRTMYSRFATKADLFEAVILKFVQDKRSFVDIPVMAGRNLAERLTMMGEKMTETLTRPDILALHFLFHKEAARFPELVRIADEAGRKPSRQVLIDILKEGGVEGDLVFLADQFHFLIQGPVSRYAVAGNVNATEELLENARRAVDFFLKGCGMGK
ncbi:TetR/AcrR family transcriptional regulator [Agrobacterium sp. NPDC089420]|uniref:TetR/AcrR family transcriptional regulator n=1 Tax=Agrobacterium sp. NPDC089420 TaxID=3363918 RepID=UPI00384EF1E2